MEEVFSWYSATSAFSIPLFFKLPCPLPPPGSVFSVIRLPLPVVCPQITFEFEVGFFSLVYFNIIYLPRSISLLIIVNKYAIVIIRKLCWKMDKNQCFDNQRKQFSFLFYLLKKNLREKDFGNNDSDGQFEFKRSIETRVESMERIREFFFSKIEICNDGVLYASWKWNRNVFESSNGNEVTVICTVTVIVYRIIISSHTSSRWSLSSSLFALVKVCVEINLWIIHIKIIQCYHVSLFYCN